MATEYRQPWDGVGTAAEWDAFCLCKQTGLVVVPHPSEAEIESTYSKPRAIGRPMLGMQYPDSDYSLNNRSVLYKYWQFGEILSIETRQRPSRTSLQIKFYMKIGSNSLRKTIPIEKCRDFATALISFKKVCLSNPPLYFQ